MRVRPSAVDADQRVVSDVAATGAKVHTPRVKHPVNAGARSAAHSPAGSSRHEVDITV